MAWVEQLLTDQARQTTGALTTQATDLTTRLATMEAWLNKDSRDSHRPVLAAPFIRANFSTSRR